MASKDIKTESSATELPKAESLILRASQVSTDRKFRATLEWTIDNFLTWLHFCFLDLNIVVYI